MAHFRTIGVMLALVMFAAGAAGGARSPSAGVPVAEPPASPASREAESPPAPADEAGAEVSEAPDFSAVDQAAAEVVDRLGLEGGAVLVLIDGRIVHERYFGRYTERTQVAIASASKWLAGATIMTLVDAGAIDLNVGLGDYLSWAPESCRAITIAQCMAHTSGLPADHDALRQWRWDNEEVARQVLRDGPEREPGSAFVYGSASMQVAACIAERVTRRSWHALFRDNLAEPLGMTATRWGAGRREPPSPSIAGAARSTLRDYGLFLAMLQRGGLADDGTRVLSEQAVEELLRDRTADVPIERATLARRLSASGYGIGNWVDARGDDGRGIINSSPGAFGFTPWIDRGRGVAAILMIEDRDRRRQRPGPRDEPLPDVRALVNDAVDAWRARQGGPSVPSTAPSGPAAAERPGTPEGE